MANTLDVLVNVRKDFTGRNAEEIHDKLIEGILKEAFPSEFDYFSVWEADNPSCLGVDDPEHIRTAASHWNGELNSQLNHTWKFLVSRMDEKGFDPYDLADFVADHRNGLELYRFTKAYLESIGRFSYGHSHLVLTNYDYDEWCTYIPEGILEDVLERPEDYAIIRVYYH